MAKKKNKDNDIGTVLVFMQAPFLLGQRKRKCKGRKGEELASSPLRMFCSRVL